jgi:hypothetical protein
MSSLAVTISKILFTANVSFLFVVLDVIMLATQKDLGSDWYGSQVTLVQAHPIQLFHSLVSIGITI